MGKKKKNKQHDYFDLSVEEQMANANAFNEYEKGEISILDALNYKVPTAPTSKSSYKKQIEMALMGTNVENHDDDYENIVNDVITKRDSSIEESRDDNEASEYIPYSAFTKYTETTNDVVTYDTYITETPKKSVTVETIIEEEKPKTETKVKPIVDNIPRICFAYNEVIGKMLVDDGYVTTPITVCHASSLELNDDNIPDDSDAFNSLISKIFFYIISCKHPAVIMTEDEFKNEFSIFSKINFNKFIFFKNKGFVYAYVIDKGESDKFYSVKDILNMDDYTLLSYLVGSAYACNTMHNIFMHEDEDEVESVMEARHSIKELIELIEKDPDTEYAGHNISRDTMSCMKVINLEKFAPDMYATLDNLLAEEDEEDDDYDDYDIDQDDSNEEETEEDDDISVNDFPDDEESSIDSMMDKIESSNNEEDDDDDEEEEKTTSNFNHINVPKIYRH